MKERLSVLGSTGSIGTKTLKVVEQHLGMLQVEGLSAGSNLKLLLDQIAKFSPRAVSLEFQESAGKLSQKLGGRDILVFWGDKGNTQIATLPEVTRVVIATPGLPGIRPTLEAIWAGKTIALATKEVLVSAGEIVTSEARRSGVKILPIDSEHSAIFQCLRDYGIDEVEKIILTCSGGPFRGRKTSDLQNVTCDQVLNHPTWQMGNKITVDSATLMNKGFEVIEAHWLFGVPIEKIEVVVHPQSVVHSAVQFIDGNIIAQLGPADMCLPIQYALLYPKRRQSNDFGRFSFSGTNLTFETPDRDTFRCLALAYEAVEKGGTATAVLTAANDVAVEAFLRGYLPFCKIPEVVEQVLKEHTVGQHPTLEKVFEADRWARSLAASLVED